MSKLVRAVARESGIAPLWARLTGQVRASYGRTRTAGLKNRTPGVRRDAAAGCGSGSRDSEGAMPLSASRSEAG